MAFTNFMSSTAGRALRIIAGLALIVIGLAVVGGTGGIVLAVVGLVPLGAGVAERLPVRPAARHRPARKPQEHLGPRTEHTMSFTASARSIDGTLRHEVDVNGRHTIITDEPEQPRRHRHRPRAARAAARHARLLHLDA